MKQLDFADRDGTGGWAAESPPVEVVGGMWPWGEGGKRGVKFGRLKTPETHETCTRACVSCGMPWRDHTGDGWRSGCLRADSALKTNPVAYYKNRVYDYAREAETGGSCRLKKAD